MQSTFYFSMPNDPVAMATFLERFPLDWKIVSGELRVAGGDSVAMQTGYYFHSSHGITAAGRENSKIDDLTGLLVGRKQPHFVYVFGVPGIDGFSWSEETRAILAGFVGKGYRGKLSVYSTSYYWNSTHTLKQCDIQFGEWNNDRKSIWYRHDEPEGRRPPRVKVFFSESERVVFDSIKPAVDLCRATGFEEYGPSLAQVA